LDSATETKTVAGESTNKDIKGKIIEFLWWMQKQGYRESTITSRAARLQRLINLKANLLDPESVKEVIAKQKNWKESRKEGVAYAYDLFAKCYGIKWTRPIYKATRKLPFIPVEREIDDLIAACNKHIALFLQIGKETGARAGEIFTLEWVDINHETSTINITPEKGSNPRNLRYSTRLDNMLNQIPKTDSKIFAHYKNLNTLRRTFQRQRKKAANKLGNPRLLRITFHTLRHWKGTTEYHKTKDILYVMKLLGHRNIKNTLLYTQLMDAKEDDYICKTAETIKDIAELIEDGFEFVCEQETLKFFRKRK
jgi:integrase